MILVRSWLLCGLLSLTAVTTTHAQEAAPPADDSSDAVARGLFQAGRASYDAGKYEDALRYFQQAYDLSQRAALLYNLGQASDRLHQDAKTIEVFRLYLQQVPNAENRAEVEGRLRTLERIVALEAAGAPSDDSAESEPGDTTSDTSAAATSVDLSADTQTSSSPGIAPWLVIGGSGAVLLTGVVLTIVGTGQIADVEGAARGSSFSDVSGSADSGPMLATTGVVLMSLGAVGAAVGVVWLLGSGDDEAAPALTVGPGTLTLSGKL